MGQIIKKSCDKSFFLRFHLKSDVAEQVLEKGYYLWYGDVVVLQIMLCEDNEVVAEVIYKEDYEELSDLG